MILTEYDEQEEREYQRAEGREEGRAEGREEGRELGLAEGLAEGRVRTLLTQIQKKHAKGKSLPQIAEELEEEEESLCPLYDLVTKYPDKTVEELLELYRKDNQSVNQL